MNIKADTFFSEATNWQEEYGKLRMIVLSCGLKEEFRWNLPCYTFNDKIIVIIEGFEEYCALLFPKGALLKNPKGILVQKAETEKSPRQIKFTNVAQILDLENTLKDYIKEAIEISKRD